VALRDLLKNVITNLTRFENNWQEEFEIHKYNSMKFFNGVIKKMKGEVNEIRDVTLTRDSLYSFYSFAYDSKGYEEGTLPWFDHTPLDLIIENSSSKFMTGINFHYIHPMMRARIFKKIILEYQENWFNDKPLMLLTWKKLNSILGNDRRYINFAVKKYIKRRIIGQRGFHMMRIKNEDMINSIALIGPTWMGINNSEALNIIKSINFNLMSVGEANAKFIK
jgi:Fe-S cluster biosynthesis and repair protein YggX